MDNQNAKTIPNEISTANGSASKPSLSAASLYRKSKIILFIVLFFVLIQLALFVPLPYYQTQTTPCKEEVTNCPSRGWHLGPSLWQSLNPNNTPSNPSEEPLITTSPSPTTSPTQAISNQTANFKTYRNEELDITLQYPPILGSLEVSKTKDAYYGTFSKNPSMVFNAYIYPYSSITNEVAPEVAIVSAIRNGKISGEAQEEKAQGKIGMASAKEIVKICDKDVLRKAIIVCSGEGGCNFYMDYFLIGQREKPPIFLFQPPELLNEYGKSFFTDPKEFSDLKNGRKDFTEAEKLAIKVYEYISTSLDFKETNPGQSDKIFPIVNAMICNLKV